MQELILIPDTMIFSREQALLKAIVGRPRKGVRLGCHESLAIECMTTDNTNVSRSIVNSFMSLVTVWFRESSTSVRLTHNALLNGQEVPVLSLDPVRSLAEKIKLKLAIRFMPDTYLSKLRKLRKAAQLEDRDNIREFTTKNKAGRAKVLSDSPEIMMERCLDPSDDWAGFALDTVLNSDKVDGYLKPESDKHKLKISTLLSRMDRAPGFRLYYCHNALQLLRVLHDPRNERKSDPSFAPDSDHLIYLSQGVRLISDDSTLHETQRLFCNSHDRFILRPNEVLSYLDSYGV